MNCYGCGQELGGTTTKYLGADYSHPEVVLHYVSVLYQSKGGTLIFCNDACVGFLKKDLTELRKKIK